MVSYSYSIRPDQTQSYLSKVGEVADPLNIEVQVNFSVNQFHIQDIEDGLNAKFKRYHPQDNTILIFEK